MVAEFASLDAARAWADADPYLEAGVYAMYSLGWSADYADPQDFLDVLFHSESSLNHSDYARAEVDALLEAARVELDEARRLARYAEAFGDFAVFQVALIFA